VVLVNPPHEPHAPAFAAAGVPASHLLWLTPGPPAAQLWASEQALRCQDVAAVLAWLPQARAAELRRLQQAAAQTGALLFVLRPDRHGGDAATPARLRLRVSAAVPAPQRPRLQLVGEGGVPAPAPTAATGSWPQLRIELLKRRGPPRQEPLWLPACGVALGALLRASAQPPVAAIAAVGTGAGARGALRAGGARTVAAPGLPGLHDLSHLPVREGRRALAGAALAVA
jgi:protein ImuA